MAGCYWQTSRGDTICISADNVVSHLDYLVEHVRRLLSLCACLHNIVLGDHHLIEGGLSRIISSAADNQTGVCANNQGACPLDPRGKTARWIFADFHFYV